MRLCGFTALLLSATAGCGADRSALPMPESGAPTASDVTTSSRAAEAPLLIEERSQLDAAVGKLVTIVGTQTRTKIPTVLGVDVDGDYELSDRRVQVSGILHRRTVEPKEPDPDELPVATRGPGTYYSVIDPATNTLAKPVLAP